MRKQYADAAYQARRRAEETQEQREARLTRERERAAERRARERGPEGKKKPGRKPIPGKGKREYSVYLNEAQAAKAKRLGNSLSEGVRVALDMVDDKC